MLRIKLSRGYMRNIISFMLSVTLSADMDTDREEKLQNYSRCARYIQENNIDSLILRNEHFAFKSYYRIRDETTKCTHSV